MPINTGQNRLRVMSILLCSRRQPIGRCLTQRHVNSGQTCARQRKTVQNAYRGQVPARSSKEKSGANLRQVGTNRADRSSRFFCCKGLLLAADEEGLPSVAEAVLDAGKADRRQFLGDGAQGQVMEPAATGLTLEPTAVVPHLTGPLYVAERPVGTQHAENRSESYPAPFGIRHVDRKDEPATRPQQTEGLAENAVVAIGGPDPFCFRIRLSVLNGHAGDGSVELPAFPRGQAGAEITRHEPNLLWTGGRLHPRSQSAESALVGGGTIQPDDLPDRSTAFFPKRL